MPLVRPHERLDSGHLFASNTACNNLSEKIPTSKCRQFSKIHPHRIIEHRRPLDDQALDPLLRLRSRQLLGPRGRQRGALGFQSSRREASPSETADTMLREFKVGPIAKDAYSDRRDLPET